jgi:hypothetical protein
MKQEMSVLGKDSAKRVLSPCFVYLGISATILTKRADTVAQPSFLVLHKNDGRRFFVRETACKYLQTSLKSGPNAVKMRVWETTSTSCLGFRNGFCAELPLFRLERVMSNLAFIFKRM